VLRRFSGGLDFARVTDYPETGVIGLTARMKFRPPEMAQDSQLLERFQREARAARDRRQVISTKDRLQW
jgi:hypothetical protein